MFSKVQRIWHQFESKQMCIHGIFKDDIGFYCFQKRKLPDPNKIEAIVNMPPPKNPQHIQVFNKMAQFYK
jgi:hypothetical protein